MVELLEGATGSKEELVPPVSNAMEDIMKMSQKTQEIQGGKKRRKRSSKRKATKKRKGTKKRKATKKRKSTKRKGRK